MLALGQRLEPTAGIEPATCHLRGGCSTRLSYVGLGAWAHAWH